MSLRDFQDTDYASLTALWDQTGIGNPARGDTLESIHRTLVMGGRLFVLARGSTVVGSLWVTDDGRRLYLHHMAVLPELQGRGLAGRLMEAAVEIMGERRLTAKLEVAEINARAVSLYRKYGFEIHEGYRTMVRKSPD